jgi:hypothetical protein
MTAKTETPRTDCLTGTFYLRCDDCPQPDKCEQIKCIHPDDAGDLERENAALRERLERAEKQSALAEVARKWANARSYETTVALEEKMLQLIRAARAGGE